jgi:hypothetical protein
MSGNVGAELRVSYWDLRSTSLANLRRVSPLVTLSRSTRRARIAGGRTRRSVFDAGLSATFRWNESWLQQAERTANAYTPDGNRE